MKKRPGISRFEAVVAIAIAASIFTSIVFVLHRNDARSLDVITDFKSCIARPNAMIQESYPQVCVTDDGRRFTDPAQSVDSLKYDEQ